MNIEDVKNANELLKELKTIDRLLEKSKSPYCYIGVCLLDENTYLYKRGREKIIETVKKIRKDIIQELKELGVEINDEL